MDGASTTDGPGDPPDAPSDAQSDPPSDAPSEKPAANASVRQLSLNVVSSYASFVIGIVLSLVLTRVLLRHLGAGTYGLWIVLLALVGYLGLLDIGVGTEHLRRKHQRDGSQEMARVQAQQHSLDSPLLVGAARSAEGNH